MQVNQEDRVITAKIVYYGPALGGKTTNLEAIHRLTDPEQRNTLLSLKTEGDRTLFFDLLPFELGNLMGFRFGFKLYTVPGQIKYAATRKKVLEGADGVVFVADSQQPRGEDNRKSFGDLRNNLKANRIDLNAVPLVLQYNKQDLSDLITANELEADLNARRVPSFKSVAVQGKGVLDSLAAIVEQIIQAAIESNGNRLQRAKNQDISLAIDGIFAPFYARARELSGEAKPVARRVREVRISSRAMDASNQSDGPIRGDLVLEPLDLLSRSVQSSLVIAEEASRFLGLEQRIGKTQRDLTVLADLSTRATDESDFDQVLTQTLERAIENTGADCGSLLLVNSSSRTMGEKVLKGLSHDPLNGKRVQSLGTLAYLFAQRKEPMITNRIEDCLNGSNASAELDGFYGLASYPLVARNLPLGLLNLYTTRPGKAFGEEQKLFLTILSNILGLYLLNALYALKQTT